MMANDKSEERQIRPEDLDAERERLRITLASIGDAVISTDAEGRVVFLNSVAETLTGWTQAVAEGQPLTEVFQIVNEYTREPAENPAFQALREGVVVGLANHTILIARDGTERPIDDSAAPILDDAGLAKGAVLVFRDVTERRGFEEAQARLAAIVESSVDAIVSKTLDGIIRTWNAGAERLFGYTAEEVVGRSITVIIPPDRLHEETEILARLSRGERIEHYETVRRAKDGRLIDISLTISPTRDPEGKIIGAAKIARDITERRRAEEAQARLAAIVESSQDAIISKTLQGIIETWNTAAERLYGYTAQEAVGKPITLLIPPDRLNEEKEILARLSRGERIEHYETVRRAKDGRLIDISLTISPIRDSRGRIIGASKIARDITKRKKTEQALQEAMEALRKADRRKDEFLAMLAHELRNPLAPLRNGLQVLRLATDPDLVAKSRDIMDRQLFHMVRLIDDLLDVSRISLNKMELRRSTVLLTEVINNAVETARPAIQKAGHTLTVSLPPEPIHLDGDLTRLAQVFGNLLSNSARYTEGRGQIWLSATREDSQITVTVRDTGIGIPAAALPNVFEMFSQVDRTIERSAGGLGIGLALVKGLVEMHGGTVQAESPGEGQGSTFTVRLPILDDGVEVSTGTGKEGPESAGAERRILVVDDNQDSAASMEMMLQLMRNEVRIANNGSEAVDLAEQFRPHLILMDLGMPLLNGYEATRRIREQPWGRDIVIVALSGWGQEDDRARSRAAGCDGHLVKPLDLPELEKLLEGLGHRTEQA
ncbi:MAG TPA: PAS domain S-box protein [Thermoanaerobaculia bacterium]|nr:PAS domain S-box protein [Thermoanaerobaculia bacterium]